MLSGTKTSVEYSQSLISHVLSWTKKIIENNELNTNNMLQFYSPNTYVKIITAASTRFVGFVDGIESLISIKTKVDESTRKKVLKPDPPNSF